MNIRRLALDVDKAHDRPDLITLAAAVEAVRGVEGVNVTVNGIDMETIGTDITIEGQNIDFDAVKKAIERTGAVVNSVDQIVCGDRIVEREKRAR